MFLLKNQHEKINKRPSDIISSSAAKPAKKLKKNKTSAADRIPLSDVDKFPVSSQERIISITIVLTETQ